MCELKCCLCQLPTTDPCAPRAHRPWKRNSHNPDSRYSAVSRPCAGGRETKLCPCTTHCGHEAPAGGGGWMRRGPHPVPLPVAAPLRGLR
eukprot:scaffold85031_cov54-Phaeocystis_antarctica.AAC.3